MPKSRLIPSVFVFAILAALAAIFGSREPGFWRPGPLIDSQVFGDYEVRVYRRFESSRLEDLCERLPRPLSKLQNRIPGLRERTGFEVRKNGRRVYSAYGANVFIAEFGSNSVAAGIDITGDGTPKLAITDSFGRNGGGSIILFECGKQFRQIARVDSLEFFPELQDVDGDGIPEVIASDNAFYHWPVCRDGEPMPQVILRWRNGKYVVAPDLMFKPAPAQQDLEAKAAEIRSSPEWGPSDHDAPTALWTNAVALIYSGHEDLAWKFVDAAWKPGFPSEGASTTKASLIEYHLRSRLEGSEYWAELLAWEGALRQR